MKRQYKIGDRIFFECWDGTIGTAIIKQIENDSYLNDKHKEVKFKTLITNISKNGHLREIIEDYNCLSPNDPRCKEIAKKYKKFDKDISKITQSIINIVSAYNIDNQMLEDLFSIVKVRLNLN